MAMIYILENTETGHAYVGCTSGNMAKRMREHRCLLRKGIHKATLLQKHWNEYGESCFIIRCIEKFSSEESVVFKRARELFWMQVYSVRGKLYNEHQVSFSGTEDSLKKAAEKAAATPKSERYFEIRKEVAPRTILTKENLENNRKRQLERWRDPEYRAKMLEALARGRNKVK